MKSTAVSVLASGMIGLMMTHPVAGRTWKDIQPLHGLEPEIPFDIDTIFGPGKPIFGPDHPSNTASPQQPPASGTFAPTSPPTVAPTLSPTAVPTSPPTMQPTASPTTQPTTHPTTASPTFVPTSAPTNDPYPFNPPPSNPDPWYFNYDVRDNALYGPGQPGITANGDGFVVSFKNNGWSTAENPPNFYWKEFDDDGFGPWKGTLANHIPSKNRCHRVGLQSPVDVTHNGLGNCVEHHEVRSLAGDFRITGNRVTKQIQSNKLRLIFDRRPCSDLNNVDCQEPDPPNADFPNGWGGFADAMHVDFKIPSEHTINGKRYDAEMQIFHLHPGRRRTPTQGQVIQAKEGGFNWYFEGALKAFEYIYERDLALCSATKRRERKLLAEAHLNLGNRSNIESIDYETYAAYSTDMDRPDYTEYAEQMERLLQDGRWDPHHQMLVPSIHFYRYEGSLTEPPCGEWVSWFITDKPMIISTEQLERLKNVLFNHVDYACRRTSVHYAESVARPIQQTAGRPIYLCTPADFSPDP